MFYRKLSVAEIVNELFFYKKVYYRSEKFRIVFLSNIYFKEKIVIKPLFYGKICYRITFFYQMPL